MILHPTRDLVIIKADKPKTQTDSGLLLKEEWKTLPLTGTVEAVGPLVNTLEEGDRVLFERYASIILNDDFRLCKQSHVLAKIDD